MKLLDNLRYKKKYAQLTDQEKELLELVRIKERTIIQLQQRGIKNPRSVLRNICKKGIKNVTCTESVFTWEENNG